MYFEQIQYIVEIARTESITLAAKNNHVTQAAISKALSKIEKEYDIKLFHRNKKSTVPTKKGKEIISLATDLLAKYYELESKLNNHTYYEKNNIKISSTADVIINIIPDVLTVFKENNPTVNIVIAQEDAKKVLADVNEGKADIGFASLHEEIINDETLSFDILMEGKLYVDVSKDSYFSSFKSLTPLELLDQPIALYNGVNMKKIVKEIEEDYGPLKILVTTNNTETIKKFIENNQAIGVSPNISMINNPHSDKGNIVSVPLLLPYSTPKYYGYVFLKKRKFSVEEQELIDILKDYIKRNQL